MTSREVFREGLQTDPFFTKIEGREPFSGTGLQALPKLDVHICTRYFAIINVYCMPVLKGLGH
jgi:hypothetical protein